MFYRVNRSTASIIAGGTLSGKIGTDDVSANIPATGTVESAAVGNGKSVTVEGISLTGKDADKYERLWQWSVRAE